MGLRLAGVIGMRTSEIIGTKEKTVKLIPPKPEYVEEKRAKENRLLRTAAYCRVSTDSDEQEVSFGAQVEYYTDKIMKTKGWGLAGIFADEGLTGMSVKKRKEFNRMIRWCEQGKIDQIITKSVSRFARNTVDCLEYIRMLKRMGIGVIFEKEGIDTTKEFSEFVFTIHSSMAQAESESLSGNVKLGHRMSFKQGKVHFAYGSFLGYRKGEGGEPEIVPEEADTVRNIYELYLEGKSIGEISATLTEQGELTPKKKNEWSASTIKSILTNEKYMGDAILQKTFVEDCLTKKVAKNTGQIPMYYVENSHDPIIDKGTWNRVQEEMSRRSSLPKARYKNVVTELSKYSGKYALTGILVCDGCGSQYRRVTWYRKYAKKYVWRCTNRLDYGRKYCKDSPSIEESVLQEAVVVAIRKFIQSDHVALDGLMKDISMTVGGDDGCGLFEIKARLCELDDMLSELITLEMESETSGIYDSEFKRIKDEMDRLNSRMEDAENIAKTNNASESRIKDISDAMKDLGNITIEYDDVIVRKLISTVTVVSKEKVRVKFRTGFETEVNL
jgi:DNA invertase Pin-like site-specific DNA recombinase